MSKSGGIEPKPFEIGLLEAVQSLVCSGVAPSIRHMFTSRQTQRASFRLIYSKGRAAKEHIRTHRMRRCELRKVGAVTLTQS